MDEQVVQPQPSNTMGMMIGGVILVILIIVGMIFAVKMNKPDDDDALKIGLNPWIGHGLYYVAEEKGFFEQEDVKVELVNFDDGATGKQLINTNKVDALSLTPETAVILKDAGVDVKAVAMTDTSIGADGIVVSENIKTIADLKGKKVAFEVGSPSHFFLSYLLDQQGLTTNDLQVVNSAAPDAGAAFVAGQVDAAVTWEPWLSKAGDRAGGHLLANSKDTPILPAMPIFRTEVLEDRNDDVAAMVRALFAARDWIAANQTEAVGIIAKSFNITDAEVIEQLPTFAWFSYSDNVNGFATGTYSAKALIQSAGDLWLKLDLIKTKINADELIDTSILENLNK